MPAPPTSAAAVPATSVIEKPFLENYPNLKPYIYKEPGSGFYMGFGLIPIGVLKDKTLLAADFFQLHYINSNWDYQILGASYGVTRAQSTAYQSNNFTFTSHVKFKWGSLFSFGPLIGYEYVTFPNLDAKLIKSPYQTPYEAYSSRGMIYGGIVSETFAYKEYLIQVSEVVYKQTYSNVKTKENWTYYYDSPDVRADPGLVAPAMVSMVEFSILF